MAADESTTAGRFREKFKVRERVASDSGQILRSDRYRFQFPVANFLGPRWFN